MAIRGVGCDVAQVARIQRLLGSRFRARFLEKAFSPSEVADCTHPETGELRAHGLAARWAAKEACYKALRLERFSPRFCEMQVAKRNRLPELVLSGATLQACRSEGVGALHLSLSHDGAYCFATVTCEEARGLPRN